MKKRLRKKLCCCRYVQPVLRSDAGGKVRGWLECRDCGRKNPHGLELGLYYDGMTVCIDEITEDPGQTVEVGVISNAAPISPP